MCSEILQRELELLGLASEEDLDHDERLERNGGGDSGRHMGRIRLAEAADGRRGG